MKKIIVLALLVASGSAFASPCPKGNNSHLGDTTGANATASQQAELDRLAAAANTAGSSSAASLTHQGFRTAFPH
jgi:hypothetical protein